MTVRNLTAHLCEVFAGSPQLAWEDGTAQRPHHRCMAQLARAEKVIVSGLHAGEYGMNSPGIQTPTVNPRHCYDWRFSRYDSFCTRFGCMYVPTQGSDAKTAGRRNPGLTM